MKSIWIIVLAGWFVMNAGFAYADTYIWLNVSIKVIVDPQTGMTPSSMNDAALRASVVDMNRWLENNWRGYRIRLVDLNANQTFRRVGTLNDNVGPGKYYDTNLKTNDAANAMFETEAETNTSLFGWNNAAINIYFNNSGWSSAQYPGNGRDLVQSGYGLFLYDLLEEQTVSDSYKIAGNLLHELGHYFGLPHTHPGNQPGDGDGIAETAPDAKAYDDTRNEIYVRDTMAQYNYSKNYSALTASQKQLVDNTANNIMSYYQLFYDDPDQSKVLSDAERFGPTRFLLTEDQMDLWTDHANSTRSSVASGRSIFVGGAGIGFQLGTSITPFLTVASGIDTARHSGGDIVMIRPGHYNEKLHLTKPVTLRATREGKVVIGKP